MDKWAKAAVVFVFICTWAVAASVYVLVWPDLSALDGYIIALFAASIVSMFYAKEG